MPAPSNYARSILRRATQARARGPALAVLSPRSSRAGTIPSVTRDRDIRHLAIRDAVTAQVTVTPDQYSVSAAKVAGALIKRCRTVLTERCRYITK